MEEAMLDDTSLFQNQTCRLIRLNHHIKPVVHSRRVRDNVLIDPLDGVADPWL
jgi:hypothetical protein